MPLIIFVSCQTRTTDKKADDNQSSNIKVSETEINVIDTLNKYVATDSIFDYDSQRIYVGKANGTEFGFHSLSDTSYEAYQKLDNKWIITDTIYFPLTYVSSPTDLNGDNLSDIIVTYHITPAGGNSQNICFIYNPFTKQLVHNEYFDLPNIKYDKKQNLVLSAWWAGVVHCQSKMCYKIAGDSLIFDRVIDYCPIEDEKNNSAYVEHYTFKNNKRISLKTEKGNQEKMWTIFENAIWNSKDDF